MNSKSINFFTIKSFLLICILSLVFLACNAFAAETSCSSNLQITTSKTSDRFFVTIKNNGPTKIKPQVFTYQKYSLYETASEPKDNSSPEFYLASGQTATISTSFTCTSEIRLTISSYASDSSSTSSSTCSTSFAVSTGTYCQKCSTCPPKTPTPTPTPVCTPPNCEAGGPYTEVECSTNPVNVQLSSAGSSSNVTYKWTSDCPQASFSNDKIANPVLSLVTAPAENTSSVTCKVNLSVTDKNNLTTSCSTQVSSKSCVKDCLGVINGTAVLDRCGVCNGDGSSCLECQSVNIQGNQFILDNNANAMRDNVLKINKELKNGGKNAKLSKNEIKAQNQYVDTSNAQAQTEYNSLWQTTYTGLPGNVLSCQSAFCVNVSNSDYKVNVAQDSQDLYKLAENSYLRLKNIERKAKKSKSPNLKKVQNSVKKAKLLLESSAQLRNQNVVELSKIPANQSSCS